MSAAGRAVPEIPFPVSAATRGISHTAGVRIAAPALDSGSGVGFHIRKYSRHTEKSYKNRKTRRLTVRAWPGKRMDESLANLGPRVKALRQERGLTLQQVSERSGVSVSTLSKVENGQVSGTVNTMLRIARGLGVLFDHLLEDPVETAPPPTGRLVRTTAGQVDEFPTEFYDYYVHSSEMVGRQMLPLVIDVKTRQPPPRVDWSTHEGEEFLLVLQGEIEFNSEHYRPIHLRAGDSIYFDSSMRHAYVSVGEGDARVVSVSLAADGDGAGARVTHLQRRIEHGENEGPTMSVSRRDNVTPMQADTSKSSNPYGGRTEQ